MELPITTELIAKLRELAMLTRMPLANLDSISSLIVDYSWALRIVRRHEKPTTAEADDVIRLLEYQRLRDQHAITFGGQSGTLKNITSIINILKRHV